MVGFARWQVLSIVHRTKAGKCPSWASNSESREIPLVVPQDGAWAQETSAGEIQEASACHPGNRKNSAKWLEP